MTTMTSIGGRAGTAAAVVLSLTILSGCEVTNPGPIQDEFLALPASQQGLINGAKRAMSELISDRSYESAVIAREIFPGGQTGSSGLNNQLQSGHVKPGSNNGWTDAVQARFIAETAIARFTDAELDPPAPGFMIYQAHLWAGYAYRTVGEWYCEAVIGSTDPTDIEPGVHELNTDTYITRAISNFTAALGIAGITDDQRYAALAGRASAYVWAEQWANAAADAAQVPDDFVFVIEMDDQESAIYNSLFEAVGGVFRSYTQLHTFFDDYYTTTGDPRTPWGPHPEFTTTTASLQGYANNPVPFRRQEKYTSQSDDHDLATGWEMRLVQAEAALAQGDFASAQGLINQVRTRNIAVNTTGLPTTTAGIVGGSALAEVTFTNVADGYTALKRERYVELWLEGRRMGDERRWAENSTPGVIDLPDFESQSTLFTSNPRSTCFDIPDAERESNPNVPTVTG